MPYHLGSREDRKDTRDMAKIKVGVPYLAPSFEDMHEKLRLKKFSDGKGILSHVVRYLTFLI